ncbi:MAG TPA: 30S ribosomal protein S6 [Acidobacteriaceae bacterium]|jgi:small subunit ribosomal protein S6|nr:30S ribosomal protein S6 [Acidobacteriaceae bacterium]
MATDTKMNRTYEVMFIVRPDQTDEDLDKLIAGIEATITGAHGTVKSVEKLGRRKLAYLVKKFSDGLYVLLTIEADGKLVAEVERRLRVLEPVIKFITVRMDLEQKRIDKVKAKRAAHPKLSAQQAVATAAATEGTPATEAPVPPAPAAAATEEPAAASA